VHRWRHGHRSVGRSSIRLPMCSSPSTVCPSNFIATPASVFRKHWSHPSASQQRGRMGLLSMRGQARFLWSRCRRRRRWRDHPGRRPMHRWWSSRLWCGRRPTYCPVTVRFFTAVGFGCWSNPCRHRCQTLLRCLLRCRYSFRRRRQKTSQWHALEFQIRVARRYVDSGCRYPARLLLNSKLISRTAASCGRNIDGV